MNKYLTTQFAKKILLVGSILFVVGLVLALVPLFGLYDMVGNCSPETGCQVPAWRGIVVNIGSYVTEVGFLTIIAGIIDFIISYIRKS